MGKGKLVAILALPIICIAVGIYLLCLAFGGMENQQLQSEGYLVTEGYYESADLHSEAEYDPVKNKHTSATYYLTYRYEVEGDVYRITTDYATGVLPKEGSTREIRYDPQDPSRAIISGAGRNSGLLLGGIMFTVIPLIIIFGALFYFGILKNGAQLLEFFMGTVMAVIGYGAIYGMSNGFSIIRAFKNVGIICVIPCLMILAGVYQMLRILFRKKE